MDCHRDISLGLIQRTPNDHSGGIVRNNFICAIAGRRRRRGHHGRRFAGHAGAAQHDLLGGAYPKPIEYRFADTTGIVDQRTTWPIGRPPRATARLATLAGNVWTAAPPGSSRRRGTGDLHLAATAAVGHRQGHGPADARRGLGWPERVLRGAMADVGADELGGPDPAAR